MNNSHYIVSNNQTIIINNKNGMNPSHYKPIGFIPENNYNCCYSEQVEELILPICK